MRSANTRRRTNARRSPRRRSRGCGRRRKRRKASRPSSRSGRRRGRRAPNKAARRNSTATVGATGPAVFCVSGASACTTMRDPRRAAGPAPTDASHDDRQPPCLRDPVRLYRPDRHHQSDRHRVPVSRTDRGAHRVRTGSAREEGRVQRVRRPDGRVLRRHAGAAFLRDLDGSAADRRRLRGRGGRLADAERARRAGRRRHAGQADRRERDHDARVLPVDGAADGRSRLDRDRDRTEREPHAQAVGIHAVEHRVDRGVRARRARDLAGLQPLRAARALSRQRRDQGREARVGVPAAVHRRADHADRLLRVPAADRRPGQVTGPPGPAVKVRPFTQPARGARSYAFAVCGIPCDVWRMRGAHPAATPT
ncbi:hypothetical protein F01_460159 [Burkholderia cenocepacia]|nr:hypothetical protein F01_460159 [Burkholderia cenocepacia]